MTIPKAAKKTTRKKTATKIAKKTTAKKAATKTKKNPTRRDSAEKMATLSKAQRISAVMGLINAPGKVPTIQRADESNSSYLLRRPTGIISLDIKLAGGFPASAPVMLAGPDGAGKDYLLFRTAAEAQKLYGDDFAMAIYLTEFKLDKPFLRDMCGLKVKATDEELEELDLARHNAGIAPLTEEEWARYQEQDGEILVIEGVVAEYGFDAIIECVASNAFQIVAVNSVGFMQTLAKDKTESYEEFAQQRGEALLLSKFMPDLSLTMNATTLAGERNETTVILIDQVRSNDTQKKPMKGRPVSDRDKYRPARQVWALKHGLAITIILHKGRKLYDEVEKVYLGRTTPWEIIKGKLGTHDGIRGDYNFYYAGGADIVGDLIITAMDLQVIGANGAHYYFEDPTTGLDFKAHGKERVRQKLLASPELCDRIKYLCLQSAGIVYRHI